MHVTQALAKTFQAGKRACGYLTVQSAIIVDTGTQSHRLA
jgi:hypothetical protein